MMNSIAGWVSILSVILSVGCGGAPAAPAEGAGAETAAAGGEGEPATASDAEVSWSEMNQDQRLAYMQETVFPRMQELFQQFDGTRFAEFSCATCHGTNAREVHFEMPNTLAPLDPAGIPAIFRSDQPMAVFMTQRVWPTMTELLGQEPFDPETGQGFSCLNCHATKASATE